MKVLVVLPTYNERPNLETLAARLLQHPFAHLLVVDDASPDGTGEIADRLAQTTNGRVSVLHRTGPRGLGRAYIDGLRHALTTDADAIGQMDGDLSHDPSYLPSLVESLASHDLVIGSRYMRGVSVVNWSLRRIALSAFANRYIRTVTGLRTSDVTSGYRLWQRLNAAQSGLRARLCREVPAPASASSEPMAQLIAHLSIVVDASSAAASADVFVAFQHRFGQGLFDIG